MSGRGCGSGCFFFFFTSIRKFAGACQSRGRCVGAGAGAVIRAGAGAGARVSNQSCGLPGNAYVIKHCHQAFCQPFATADSVRRTPNLGPELNLVNRVAKVN